MISFVGNLMVFLVYVCLPVGVFVGILGVCCLYKSLDKSSKVSRPAAVIPRYTRELMMRKPLLQCPHCGAEYGEDDLFCNACGTQVTVD